MGSMLARSVMQKKRIEEWIEIGLYPRRALSIFNSVSCSHLTSYPFDSSTFVKRIRLPVQSSTGSKKTLK